MNPCVTSLDNIAPSGHHELYPISSSFTEHGKMSYRSICLVLILLIRPIRAGQLRGRRWELADKTAGFDVGRIPWGEEEVDLASINDGSNSDRPRIVGGQIGEVQPNFAMLLGSADGGYRFVGCGGTLISNCHVLTAAHCVADERSESTDALYINAYEPFSGNGNNPYHFSMVKSFKVHPNYMDGDTYNDVAIMTLSTCVDSNPNKYYFMNKIMRLADNDFMQHISENQWVKVSGFGKLSEDSSSYPQTIRSVKVPFISNQVCKNKYHGKKLSIDEICAGAASGGKDSCQGDSGGPLFINDGDVQYQLGIVSRGYGCSQPNSPGVYSSVAYHYDFIQNHVCAYSQSKKSDICNDYAISSGSNTMATAAPELQPNDTLANSGSPQHSVPSFHPNSSPTTGPTSGPTDGQTFAPSLRPSESPSSSPSFVQAMILGNACPGICIHLEESLKNPYDTVTLPNGKFQFCIILDYDYKALHGEPDLCRTKSQEAQKSGCSCG
jgi:secreted trypsin-like serine protease